MFQFVLRNWKLFIANRFHLKYHVYSLKPQYVHSSFSLFMNYQIYKWGLLTSNSYILQKIKKVLLLRSLFQSSKKTKTNITFFLIKIGKKIK
mmetsp:Transcript_17838/g.24910  ORF Transcript_17838/g.24910 Transcript_17838/m.24910 type:complete len:92 (-) Transcript_17838:496-771(-)